MDKIKVIINNNQNIVKIPTGLRMIVRRSCNAVLRNEEFQGSAIVGVSFVDNEAIQELNKKYRNIDAPTDVLSFPTNQENGNYAKDPITGDALLGDVVISLQKAAEQAQVHGNTLQKEVSFLTVHSMLHLLGYVHEEGGLEKSKMREKEDLVMEQMGFVSFPTYFVK